MEVDVEKTFKPEVLKRVPLFNRVSNKTLLEDPTLAAKCSELRLAAAKLVKEQNTAAATQSQSKRKAEVAGGTTDNSDSYLKKAKSAQRTPYYV